MSRRFFADSPITSQTALLTGQEAQHLSKVMRANIGDELTLFDGTGAEYSAQVAKIRRSEVVLSIIDRREVDRELPFRLVIGVALPKGERQRWLVEKLVELGVSGLTPLVTARSVAQPSVAAIARLQRAVIEASKQCGRNRLMAIGQPSTFDDFLTGAIDSRTRLIAHPPIAGRNRISWTPHHDNLVVAIGPEGGFTDREVALAEASHWNQLSLGARVLRTETAALAVASAVAVQAASSI